MMQRSGIMLVKLPHSADFAELCGMGKGTDQRRGLLKEREGEDGG